jgi:hypothetical protein
MSSGGSTSSLGDGESGSVAPQGGGFSIASLVGFVSAFGYPLTATWNYLFPPTTVQTVPVVVTDLTSAQEAIKASCWASVLDFYKNGGASPDVKKSIRQAMFDTEAGKQGLRANSDLAAVVLADVDASFLAKIDLDATFGEAKNDVLAGAALGVAGKYPPQKDTEIQRETQRDPEVFKLLTQNISQDMWNDTNMPGGTPKRGLGTRVCQKLWQNQGYDEICDLIKAGVDTTVAARSAPGAKGGGVYSGFVQPLQHIIQGSLRDIDELAHDENALTGLAKRNAQGAKKIFAALEETDTSITVTDWNDVKNSEMIQEFTENPGTIWGFEDIRLPFVQAAHDTDNGAQPLRMMEIWEAVEQALTPEAYGKLLDEPENEAARIAELGVTALRDGMQSTMPGKVKKYADLKKASKDYVEEFVTKFKTDATAFLIEFASQMPKASFARQALDETGKARKDTTVSALAGIAPTGKFEGGLACKAGLWWAKKEAKPVYYCLDGVNMDDVINYKAAKNKAIDDYLDPSKREEGAQGHDEVITFVELREILKRWDDLRDTVKFVLKGKVYTQEEADKKVEEWRKKMEEMNKAAGRAPAPPKATFVHELNALDPGLMDRIINDAEGDKDARDIVRKAGYLVKVARTRPEIVLKYIISKCGVLVQYDLIPQALVDDAARLDKIARGDSMPEESMLKDAAQAVVDGAKTCNVKFRAPLLDALVGHPLVNGRAK